ncbi:MAG: ABC transporter permease [Lachnospiraceae bacterium]|nr:ABC transporter permease [Lachnospiraceae bacterium]MDE6251260.1 ABC transporter permease [Lachnospiraceae bacterium]
MIRLIKMNIYRALHSKSTWILLIVTMAFGLFAAYMEKTDLDMMKDSYDMINNAAEQDEEPMGITVQTPDIHEDGTEPYILEYVCADIGSCILCISVTIFAVIFVNAEYSSGFVKNIAGQVKRRWGLYASKMVVIMIFTMLFMIVYAAAQIIALSIFLENPDFGVNMIGNTIKYALAEWCLYSAFASGLVLAVTVLNNTPIGIIWGLLSSMGFGTIVGGFINKVVDIDDFNICKYFVTENIKSLVRTGTASEYADALILALAFFTVYNLLGIMWVNKKDIKA